MCAKVIPNTSVNVDEVISPRFFIVSFLPDYWTEKTIIKFKITKKMKKKLIFAFGILICCMGSNAKTIMEASYNIAESPYSENSIIVADNLQTEIIGKWRESSSGSFNYIWLLERNKSNGKYKVTVTYPGGAKMTFNCIRKNIKSNEYIFHDPYLNRTFTLKAGETIYFIPNFDHGANAILLIAPNNVTRVYTNDIDNRYYELFSELQSIR